jgi:hypothetical protein
MKTIASAKFVRWVTENNRPFQNFNNCGFQCLMKTGRPEYYIPLVNNLSRDVFFFFFLFF